MLINVAYANTNIPVFFNDYELRLSKEPVMQNGTVLVPFRDIFETLGYLVYYDSSTERISCKKDGSEITLYIDSTYANVSGDEYRLSEAPRIIDGVTMVPLRFVSEAAGYSVNWVSENNSNYITIDNFDPNLVNNTDKYEEEMRFEKAISEQREKEDARIAAKNKEREEQEAYNNKKSDIIEEYHNTWVSKHLLKSNHDVYALWQGDYISFLPEVGTEEIFRIEGSPKDELVEGVIYEGNGVRYQYISTLYLPFPEAKDGTGYIELNINSIVFSVPDLKRVGVIE